MKKFAPLFLLLFISIPAYAQNLCAHVETGQALDVQSCHDTTDYLARYTTQVTAAWNSVIVPAGTQHNATANPGGTYTNPPIVTAPSFPKTLTKLQYQQYVYTTLGAIYAPTGNAMQQQIAGITRFGVILLAMKNSSDPATAAALDGYNNNVNFDLPYVTVFLGIIGPSPGSAIVTSAEATAFITNWPTQ